MAILISGGVLGSCCTSPAISVSYSSRGASLDSPCNIVFKQEASYGQRRIVSMVRTDANLTVSRRVVLYTSLSTLGLALVPKGIAAEEVRDKDLREKLLEEINNLQRKISKSFDDAKEAVTSKAEEAISLLKFGNDEATEAVKEMKSAADTTSPNGKLAQS